MDSAIFQASTASYYYVIVAHGHGETLIGKTGVFYSGERH